MCVSYRAYVEKKLGKRRYELKGEEQGFSKHASNVYILQWLYRHVVDLESEYMP
jgi:hypothetical protein